MTCGALDIPRRRGDLNPLASPCRAPCAACLRGFEFRQVAANCGVVGAICCQNVATAPLGEECRAGTCAGAALGHLRGRYGGAHTHIVSTSAGRGPGARGTRGTCPPRRPADDPGSFPPARPRGRFSVAPPKTAMPRPAREGGPVVADLFTVDRENPRPARGGPFSVTPRESFSTATPARVGWAGDRTARRGILGGAAKVSRGAGVAGRGGGVLETFPAPGKFSAAGPARCRAFLTAPAKSPRGGGRGSHGLRSPGAG